MNSPQENHILAALPVSELEKFAMKLRPVPLKLGHVLYAPSQMVEHVYFPTAGVISLLAAFEDGTTVEAGVIGREGMLGTSVVLGAETTPHQALVQADGHALKLPAAIEPTPSNSVLPAGYCSPTIAYSKMSSRLHRSFSRACWACAAPVSAWPQIRSARCALSTTAAAT